MSKRRMTNPRTAAPRLLALAVLVSTQTGPLLAAAFSTKAHVVPSVPTPPWYSDPTMGRDRSHVVDGRGFDYRPAAADHAGGVSYGLAPALHDALRRPTSRIIPFRDGDVYVRRLGGEEAGNDAVVEPLLLTYDECDPGWFGGEHQGNTLAWLGRQSVHEGDADDTDDHEEGGVDYFAIDLSRSAAEGSSILSAKDVESDPVRNYGDAMPSRTHAALIASANGLLAFHRTHQFCSHCGSPTGQTKAGASRKCTNDNCGASVYPRIDPAVIMLVTSPCENFALLGRNKRWPPGRYSTLAGFAEVGETFEQCVARETYEEAGVKVDPDSVRFVASQPWPFPRSVMVGFVARATADPTEGSSVDDDGLPELNVDPAELEDARWFSKEYVREKGLVEGRGSSALDFVPDDEEAEFHVPGPASLARLLITEWVTSS